ncbi:MAG: VOC family protein [Candidatus Eisenbacteria bacterium]
MPTTKPLTFGWYELMAKDVPAALAFYKKVVGHWTTKDSGMPGGTYTLIELEGRGIGGALTLTDDMCAAGARPGWLGYVAVDDLQGKEAEFLAAGGKTIRPIFEIPGVIRFTIVADPHGAVFVMFQGLTPGHSLPTFPAGTPGAVGWHELHAGDGAAAWDFYSGLFGWTKDMAVDMGPMGTYQTWKSTDAPIGGMMTKMAVTPAPFWLYYFNVEALGEALDRVKAAGGQVIHGPTQVPGGSVIANCLDPEGGIFALVSARA